MNFNESNSRKPRQNVPLARLGFRLLKINSTPIALIQILWRELRQQWSQKLPCFLGQFDSFGPAIYFPTLGYMWSFYQFWLKLDALLLCGLCFKYSLSEKEFSKTMYQQRKVNEHDWWKIITIFFLHNTLAVRRAAGVWCDMGRAATRQIMTEVHFSKEYLTFPPVTAASENAPWTSSI